MAIRFTGMAILFWLVTQVTAQSFLYPPKIVQIGAGEYLTTYLTEDGKLFVTAFKENKYQPVQYNLKGIKAVDGAQYTNIALDSNGKVYIVGIYQNGVPYVKHVKLDANGQEFSGNTNVYGWYQTYVSIRKDGLFIWGEDALLMNSGKPILAPMPLPSPPGKQIKKIVTLTMGEPSLLALASDGTVWIYKKKTSLPVKVKLNAPARNIAGVGAACYVVETNNDLLAWGYQGSYLGAPDLSQEPYSIKKFWLAAGCTFPSKELVGNYNTLHIIDANNNMFGAGENIQGEIGNGIENPNWKESTPLPYAWSWKHKEMISKPVQILGKFANLNTSNSVAFYFYVQDMGEQWYSWGRNKARCLGNGITLQSADESMFPNALDIPAPKKVSPLSVKWSVHPRINDQYRPTPIANPGIDQYISRANTILSGKSSYVQGATIVSYRWEKISGQGTIVNSNQATIQITGLTKGTHFFRLTVTDSHMLTDVDDIKIVVN